MTPSGCVAQYLEEGLHGKGGRTRGERGEGNGKDKKMENKISEDDVAKDVRGQDVCVCVCVCVCVLYMYVCVLYVCVHWFVCSMCVCIGLCVCHAACVYIGVHVLLLWCVFFSIARYESQFR